MAAWLPVYMDRTFPDQDDLYAEINAIMDIALGGLGALVGGRVADGWEKGRLSWTPSKNPG